MHSCFGRGGPLQGPRLILALLVVLLLFIYFRRPYNPPPPGAGLTIPYTAQHPAEDSNHNAPPKSPAELPPSVEETYREKEKEKESMSDKLFDYLKGHSSHSQNSHSPIPHEEIIPPSPQPSSTPPSTASKDPVCANLPDTSDLLVVVRTPASDLYHHLPAHFLTTLRCTDFLLFSTVHQNIGPYTVHDALANISDSRRSKHKEFELYDKLQHAQNAVADLSIHKEDNDHNLDRWTILSHVLAAYKMRPDKKWFVFIESDTYLSLSNIMPWINSMDHTKPLFAGAQVMIGDVELAHSGSGILLSNAAVEKLSNLSKTRMDDWEEKTGNSCCGDKILAEALQEAGIKLHRSFPMIQGETPFSLDWSDRHWCRPAMTWHRMTPQSLDMLWQFESAWAKKHAGSGELPPMLFRDYFQTFLVPLIRQSQNRSDWDNLASSLTYTDQSRAQYAHFSFDACRAACDLRHSCVQYAWEPNKCRLGTVVRWGEGVSSDKRMMSGWLVQRVEKFGETVEKCKADDMWIMPGEEEEEELVEQQSEEEEQQKDALQLEEEELQAKAEEEEEEQKAKQRAKAKQEESSKNEETSKNDEKPKEEENARHDSEKQDSEIQGSEKQSEEQRGEQNEEKQDAPQVEEKSKGLELSKRPDKDFSQENNE